MLYEECYMKNAVGDSTVDYHKYQHRIRITSVLLSSSQLIEIKQNIQDFAKVFRQTMYKL